MNDRYPYRHTGPAVFGCKMTDYLISEANMIKDGFIPASADMKLLGPDEEAAIFGGVESLYVTHQEREIDG